MSRKDIINELREWKQMLDEGLIRESDYEEHQKLLLKKLRVQSAAHTSTVEKSSSSIPGSDFFSTAIGEVNLENDLFQKNQPSEKPGSDFFQTGGKANVSSPQSNTFGGDAFATGGKTKSSSSGNKGYVRLERGAILKGRYKLQRKLGQGGMGEVWKAWDTQNSESVAIKRLLTAFQQHLGLQKRFFREIRALQQLSHENIVRILDFDEQHYFFVMEFLEGSDLRDKLKKEGPFSFEESLRLLQKVFSGLQAAHRKGLVHRDIKPENIFVCNNRGVKLLDFGIAFADSETQLTGTGQSSLGTAYYMAPEQVRGSKTIRAEADLYACGVLTYELLTGHVLMPGARSLSKEMELQLQRKPALVPNDMKVVWRTLLNKLQQQQDIWLDPSPEKRGSAKTGKKKVEELQREWTQAFKSMKEAAFASFKRVVLAGYKHNTDRERRNISEKYPSLILKMDFFLNDYKESLRSWQLMEAMLPIYSGCTRTDLEDARTMLADFQKTIPVPEVVEHSGIFDRIRELEIQIENREEEEGVVASVELWIAMGELEEALKQLNEKPDVAKKNPHLQSKLELEIKYYRIIDEKWKNFLKQNPSRLPTTEEALALWDDFGKSYNFTLSKEIFASIRRDSLYDLAEQRTKEEIAKQKQRQEEEWQAKHTRRARNVLLSFLAILVLAFGLKKLNSHYKAQQKKREAAKAQAVIVLKRKRILKQKLIAWYKRRKLQKKKALEKKRKEAQRNKRLKQQKLKLKIALLGNRTRLVSQQSVLLKAGSFSMGKKARRVRITYPFYVWKTEVTQKQLSAVLNGTRFSFGNLPPGIKPQNYDWPARATWIKAARFCNKLSLSLDLNPCYLSNGTGLKAAYRGANYWKCPGWRLPTSAEWEYAARAGSSGSHPYNLRRYAYYDTIYREKRVRSRKPNRWGLYDMLGNLAEWVMDSPDGEQLSSKNPIHLSSSSTRILRGGYYASSYSETSFVSMEFSNMKSRHAPAGFRVVMTKKKLQ